MGSKGDVIQFSPVNYRSLRRDNERRHETENVKKGHDTLIPHLPLSRALEDDTWNEPFLNTEDKQGFSEPASIPW